MPRKWIQKSINPKKKNALRESLNVPEGKKIPASKLSKAAHSKNLTTRRRANLAKTLAGFKK
jgi:hypothetical protein